MSPDMMTNVQMADRLALVLPDPQMPDNKVGADIAIISAACERLRSAPPTDCGWEHLKQTIAIWLNSYERLANIVQDCGHSATARAIRDNTSALRDLLNVKAV